MKIELEISEVNAVLVALAQRPFAEVADLIQKIRSQAQTQLEVIEGGKGNQEPEAAEG